MVNGGVKAEHWEIGLEHGVIKETPLQEVNRKLNAEPKCWINRIGRVGRKALKTDFAHEPIRLVTE